MKKNVRWWDRFIRFALGVTMTAWAIAGGPTWAYLGLLILATASWGFDPFYALVDYQPFGEE